MAPEWYDESKLRRCMYAPDYTGWVIDLGDGTCRYANEPLLGKDGPKWGDRVPLCENYFNNGMPYAYQSNIIERYENEGT